MEVDEVLLDAEDRMDKAVDALRQALATVRTGRANTALVEHLQVSHYDQQMPLNQLATLAAPDPTLITVQPWDRGAMDPIMKAIQASDLGITPSNDGTIIRLPIPSLTEERRRELVRQVHTRSEEGKVAVRNVRRSAIDELRKSLRAGELSQDDERRAQNDVDELTQLHTGLIDEVSEQKEQELLEI
ncbi:MAG: ribosome recycling factor [Chloroflexi bacterium]|nr:ribosome recycling factor [Chloroflexota bacterium]